MKAKRVQPGIYEIGEYTVERVYHHNDSKPQWNILMDSQWWETLGSLKACKTWIENRQKKYQF